MPLHLHSATASTARPPEGRGATELLTCPLHSQLVFHLLESIVDIQYYHRAGKCTTYLAYTVWDDIELTSDYDLLNCLDLSQHLSGEAVRWEKLEWMTGPTSCPSPIRFVASLFPFCHHLRMFIRKPYFLNFRQSTTAICRCFHRMAGTASAVVLVKSRPLVLLRHPTEKNSVMQKKTTPNNATITVFPFNKPSWWSLHHLQQESTAEGFSRKTEKPAAKLNFPV